jgi:hypothetical protein
MLLVPVAYLGYAGVKLAGYSLAAVVLKKLLHVPTRAHGASG